MNKKVFCRIALAYIITVPHRVGVIPTAYMSKRDKQYMWQNLLSLQGVLIPLQHMLDGYSYVGSHFAAAHDHRCCKAFRTAVATASTLVVQCNYACFHIALHLVVIHLH
jgi:hypothetical protein